ncbi:MFS transporter [Paraburkholderia sp. SIMBA_054]|uniref:MFS transporter n=1 Tax=Paraburkholderia sp. SIMBA_054 TaxID=3085795 RepID=UPI00397ADAA7
MTLQTVPHRRYRIFVLIMSLALLNYVERGAIAYAGSSITSEFGFNRAEWGALLGYFGYGYVLGALCGGAMADRFGPRRVWLWAGGAWSLFAVATAFAGEIGVAVFGGAALLGFAFIRILFGFTEGPAYSVINKSISNWAPRGERGFVLSVGLVSTPIGALITAPIAVGLLSLTGSWRVMFIVVGVSSLALLLWFIRFFTDAPEDGTFLTKEESEYIRRERITRSAYNRVLERSAPPAWWTFFQNPSLVLNAVGYFSMIYVTFLLLTWMPKYLQDTYRYDLSSIWYMAMIPWIGPCFTVLLGGKLSDWLVRRTGNLTLGRSGLAAACLLLATICFLLISKATSVWQVLTLVAVANSFNSLSNSVFWAVILDSSPSSRTGTFSGITHGIANTASVLAPTVTGVLTLRYGYAAMFVAASIATGIGVIAMAMVRPGIGNDVRGFDAESA